MKTFLIILLFCSVANGLTLSDIRTEARLLSSDYQGTRQRYTDAQITNWINEGQRLADVFALCNYQMTSFDLAAGSTYYNLPTDYIMTRRVTSDLQVLPERSPASLDSRSAEWESQTGEPTYYFTKFSSRASIGFVPVPAVVGDTTTINVEYIGYSDVLSSDSDVPFDSIVEFTGFHHILSYFAAYKMNLIDGRVEIAGMFLQQYNTFLKEMQMKCVERPNYLPGLQPQK